jgi:hypothetical protein
MRTLISTLWFSTILLLGCGDSPSTPIRVPLTFYIVSAEKIEGGRFVDTSDFPKLGYISAVPALELRQLEDVTHDTSQDRTEAVPAMAKGATFHIRMTPDDAKRFAVVTEQAVGKQMLLMLGDTPLIAARVMSPMTGPSLQLYFDEKHDSAKIGDALRALTK